MALPTTGVLSHTMIMAEFNEPPGTWRLSQDGGIILQGLGDPKGPGDEIKESDFYGLSNVVSEYVLWDRTTMTATGHGQLGYRWAAKSPVRPEGSVRHAFDNLWDNGPAVYQPQEFMLKNHAQYLTDITEGVDWSATAAPGWQNDITGGHYNAASGYRKPNARDLGWAWWRCDQTGYEFAVTCWHHMRTSASDGTPYNNSHLPGSGAVGALDPNGTGVLPAAKFNNGVLGPFTYDHDASHQFRYNGHRWYHNPESAVNGLLSVPRNQPALKYNLVMINRNERGSITNGGFVEVLDGANVVVPAQGWGLFYNADQGSSVPGAVTTARTYFAGSTPSYYTTPTLQSTGPTGPGPQNYVAYSDPGKPAPQLPLYRQIGKSTGRISTEYFRTVYTSDLPWNLHANGGSPGAGYPPSATGTSDGGVNLPAAVKRWSIEAMSEPNPIISNAGNVYGVRYNQLGGWDYIALKE